MSRRSTRAERAVLQQARHRLSAPEPPDHLAGAHDSQTSMPNLLEVAISSHEEICLGRQGERDEIVIVRIIGHDARRVTWIIEQNTLVQKPLRESFRFFFGDVVLAGNPRMKKRFHDLLGELRANDQFKFTFEPEIEEFGSSSFRGDSSRD